MRPPKPHAGLYGIDVSTQSKAMGLLREHLGPEPYKPLNSEESAALASLKVPRSNTSIEERFRRFVLRQLATIRDSGDRQRQGKRSRRAQDLRRQAHRVHTAIRRLVEGESVLLKVEGLIPSLSSWHLDEAVQSLGSYLESLDWHAKSLRANATRREVRHTVTPQNLEILELVAFVRQVTGKPHWTHLAILLKGATGDAAGMNSKRLFQLYKDREGTGQKRTLGVFRRARLRVAAGKLHLP